MSRTGVLLAAHGSLRDPSVNVRVRHIADALRERGVADAVEAGFHQGSPGYGEAFDRLGAGRVLVIPLFTSEGYYTRTVLPQALQQQQGSAADIRFAPALGATPTLVELVRQRIEELSTRFSLPAYSTSVLIVGHGTRRNPESRGTTQALVEQLTQLDLVEEVRAGFLDDDPEIESAFAALTSPTVLVIPFLIGGAHVTVDLPRRLGINPVGTDNGVTIGEAGDQEVFLDEPIGSYEGITDLVHDVVRREMPQSRTGSVALVGAGPGDPGLITVRGLQLLRSADVILHDRLSSRALLDEVRADAIVIDVGKSAGGPATAQDEINALLIRHASLGHRVLRLKGGDPFVFGRGAEELDACEAAGIVCTIVPGVSSSVAVPAAAGIPVTARGESRSFAVVTAQAELGGSHSLDEFAAGVGAVDTLVVLMGHARLTEFATQLIEAGRSPDTPVACIQDGTTSRQRVATGTLSTIADEVSREGLSAPLVTVIGTVALRASRVRLAC